jgi:hypothetical protein
MIKENSEIFHKRSILLTTSIRFSSQTQSIKEAAIDRIIEQTLFLSEKEKIDLIGIQNIINSEIGSHAITSNEIDSSLTRLNQKNRIVKETVDKKIEYRMPKRVKKELSAIEVQADVYFSEICHLFRFKPATFSSI